MFQYTNVSLHSMGYHLPPRKITSEEIEEQLAALYKRLKLPHGRLELMSGIRERRLWSQGTLPSEAAIMAGENALKNGLLKPEEIECLIFTSVSRDMMEPSTASFVHNGLGLSSRCLVFDISNACLGFLNGLTMLANMIELGQIRTGMVVSGETAEDLVSSTIKTLLEDESLTRKKIKPAFASLTIGSGCVGVVLTAGSKARPALKYGVCRANTAHVNLCQGDHMGEGTLMDTNSEELLYQGVDTALSTWQEFSAAPGWAADDIDIFCCHQVGVAHAKRLFEKLGLDPRKNFQTLAELGNVGSVSAPVTLAMAMEKQHFISGMKAALLGIGSGINCMMLGLEWKNVK